MGNQSYTKKNDSKQDAKRQGNSKKEIPKIPKPDVPAFLDNSNYVTTAELVVLHLIGEDAQFRFNFENDEYELKPLEQINKKQKFSLTTTKIRNLLSLLNVIQQMVQGETGSEIKDEEILGKIQYFKMRCAYEAGREPAVRDFVEKANIMNYINNIGTSKKEFELFFHYIESLVAYHRYYGGDN